MSQQNEIMAKLKTAVREGNEDKVSNILSYLGVNYFKCHLAESQTLLSESLTRGHSDIAKLLLEYGAAVNNLFGSQSPFHLACITGNIEMVHLLLQEEEVDINARDFRGETPLQYVMNLSRIKTYISQIFDKSNDVLYKDQINSYCMKVSVEIGQILLDHGANINLFDACKATPLHIACETGNLDGVKLLLKYNADITLRNVSGKTAVHYCIERGSHHLHCADIIKLLVAKGFIVNTADIYGWTPLHCAVDRGSGNRVIPAPFDCSRLIRSIEITKYLLDNGACTSMKDFRGETPLHLAVKTENLEKVQLILNRYPDIDARDEKGETALYKAHRSRNTDITKLLLKYGANPNIQCNTGDTVLHCALLWRKDSVNLFLDYNADITIVNNKNKSPLDIALELMPDHSCYIAKHMILTHANKLKAAGLSLQDINIDYLRSSVDFYFYEKCYREIRFMKRSVIYNNISYYDLLTVPDDKLVVFLNNTKIDETVSSEKYKTAFPLYSEFFEKKLTKATERKNLVRTGHEFFSTLDKSLPKLSYYCIENIINNLSNRDLQVLRKCV